MATVFPFCFSSGDFTSYATGRKCNFLIILSLLLAKVKQMRPAVFSFLWLIFQFDRIVHEI
uniref:Uncharacterized protein n=1 Tax=Daphnia magna TaxID=35525 RepID=A0A0P6AYL2_9CRUS